MVIDGQCDTKRKDGKMVANLIKKEQDGKRMKDGKMSRKCVMKTTKKGSFFGGYRDIFSDTTFQRYTEGAHENCFCDIWPKYLLTE